MFAASVVDLIGGQAQETIRHVLLEPGEPLHLRSCRGASPGELDELVADETLPEPQVDRRALVGEPEEVAWKSALALRLAKAKRYPAEAQVRGQSGVATVRVRLDRSGRVMAKALVKSSGVDALDRESLALIERAQPLPAPPVGMAAPLELTVPVQFSLR